MRILIIADVSNLYYCVRKRFGKKLDYSRLLDVARNGHEVVEAFAYGAELDGAAIHFKKALEHIGFTPKYKEAKVFHKPGTDRQDRKADWDVGMAMDIVRFLDQVDIVILCSADGDLAPCVEYIKEQGKECVILACGISHELKNCATHWIEIDEEMLT